MLARPTQLNLWMTVLSLLALAACAPGLESAPGVNSPTSAAATVSSAPPGTGVVSVVDTTPMSETELAAQPTGQSEPGLAATGPATAVGTQPPGGQPEPGSLLVYTDTRRSFSVDYPSNFVIRPRPAEMLARLNPAPAAAVLFINPATAARDVAGLEPADLEIRAYSPASSASLQSWLASNDLLPAGSTTNPFQTTHVSGVGVCTALLAPGCSYFVLGPGRIYQLTPASVAGQAMIDSFALLP